MPHVISAVGLPSFILMRMKITVSLLLVALLTLTAWALTRDDDFASVKGRVTTLWGEPFGEAEVSFYELEGIRGNSPTEKLVRRVVADKDGNYKADKLAPGQYRVDVSARTYGHTEVWRFYLARDADEVLDVGVPMGYLHHISQMTVSGVVRQANGSPVKNATVTLTNAYDATESQQTRTDDKGKYKFMEIQVGDYVLYSAKSGFYPSATTFRLDNGEQQVADVKLEVAPKFDVLGREKK